MADPCETSNALCIRGSPMAVSHGQARAPHRGCGFGCVERIARRVEIGNLLKHGSRYQCTGLSIVFRENGRQHDRMGVIVSRALGGAVVRNRIKRHGREMFRRFKASQAPYLDILFVPRKGFERPSALAGQEYQTWREHYVR